MTAVKCSFTPRINRRTSVICAVVFCLIPVFFCSAGSPAKTVAAYTVSSKGFTIGDVTTTQRTTLEGGASRVQFETRTAIRASFLWMGYRLTSTEKGTLRDGVLVSYSAKGEENGVAIDVEGRLVNEEFRFDLHEQGGKRTIVIPRNSYDYTTMECPEARLDFSTRQMITLRILDVEKMTVVKRDYRFVGNEQYTLAGKEYPCRVIIYSDQNKNARRWIAWDGTAVIMYRQDGRGEKNSYSVQATSVVKEL